MAPRARVKLYVLNAHGDWDDRGTGTVAVEPATRGVGAILRVVAEADGAVALAARVARARDVRYTMLNETIISWTEPCESVLVQNHRKRTVDSRIARHGRPSCRKSERSPSKLCMMSERFDSARKVAAKECSTTMDDSLGGCDRFRRHFGERQGSLNLSTWRHDLEKDEINPTDVDTADDNVPTRSNALRLKCTTRCSEADKKHDRSTSRQCCLNSKDEPDNIGELNEKDCKRNEDCEDDQRKVKNRENLREQSMCQPNCRNVDEKDPVNDRDVVPSTHSCNNFLKNSTNTADDHTFESDNEEDEEGQGEEDDEDEERDEAEFVARDADHRDGNDDNFNENDDVDEIEVEHCPKKESEIRSSNKSREIGHSSSGPSRQSGAHNRIRMRLRRRPMEMALSFAEAAACRNVYEQIIRVQGRTSNCNSIHCIDSSSETQYLQHPGLPVSTSTSASTSAHHFDPACASSVLASSAAIMTVRDSHCNSRSASATDAVAGPIACALSEAARSAASGLEFLSSNETILSRTCQNSSPSVSMWNSSPDHEKSDLSCTENVASKIESNVQTAKHVSSPNTQSMSRPPRNSQQSPVPALIASSRPACSTTSPATGLTADKMREVIASSFSADRMLSRSSPRITPSLSSTAQKSCSRAANSTTVKPSMDPLSGCGALFDDFEPSAAFAAWAPADPMDDSAFEHSEVEACSSGALLLTGAAMQHGQYNPLIGASNSSFNSPSAAFTMPQPDRSNLEILANIFSEPGPLQIPALRDRVVAELSAGDYVSRLCELFGQAEDLLDVDALRLLYFIFRALFLLGNNVVIENLVNEKNIMSVIGVLEYDPDIFPPRPSEFANVTAPEKPHVSGTESQSNDEQHLDLGMPVADFNASHGNMHFESQFATQAVAEVSSLMDFDRTAGDTDATGSRSGKCKYTESNAVEAGNSAELAEARKGVDCYGKNHNDQDLRSEVQSNSFMKGNAAGVGIQAFGTVETTPDPAKQSHLPHKTSNCFDVVNTTSGSIVETRNTLPQTACTATPSSNPDDSSPSRTNFREESVENSLADAESSIEGKGSEVTTSSVGPTESSILIRRHRDFLIREATFKSVVTIPDATVLAKIHQNYRVTFIKDVVLPRVLDDSALSVLSSLVLCNNIDIVMYFLADKAPLEELFQQFNMCLHVQRCSGLIYPSCEDLRKNSEPDAGTALPLQNVINSSLSESTASLSEKLPISESASDRDLELKLKSPSSSFRSEQSCINKSTASSNRSSEQSIQCSVGDEDSTKYGLAGSDDVSLVTPSSPRVDRKQIYEAEDQDQKSSSEYQRCSGPRKYSDWNDPDTLRSLLGFLNELCTLAKAQQPVVRSKFHSVLRDLGVLEVTLETLKHRKAEIRLLGSDILSTSVMQDQCDIRMHILRSASSAAKQCSPRSSAGIASSSAWSPLYEASALLHHPESTTMSAFRSRPLPSSNVNSSVEISGSKPIPISSSSRRDCMNADDAPKSHELRIENGDHALTGYDPQNKHRSRDSSSLLAVQGNDRPRYDLTSSSHETPAVPGCNDPDSSSEKYPLLSAMLDVFCHDSGSGVFLIVLELLKSLLDPSTMRNTVEGDSFLEIFYDRFIVLLLKPLRLLPEDDVTNESVEMKSQPANLDCNKGYLCDLLSFCVTNHAYRMKYFVLGNDVVGKVVHLLKHRRPHVRLAALRFFRSCVGICDDIYDRYIVRKRLQKPVFDMFAANRHKDNLINSAVLDLVSFITAKQRLTLLADIMENYKAPLEGSVEYSPVFVDAKKAYDGLKECDAESRTESPVFANQCLGSQTYDGMEASVENVAHGRGQDLSDEAYGADSSECEPESNRLSHSLFSRRDVRLAPDLDEDEDYFSTDNGDEDSELSHFSNLAEVSKSRISGQDGDMLSCREHNDSVSTDPVVSGNDASRGVDCELDADDSPVNTGLCEGSDVGICELSSHEVDVNTESLARQEKSRASSDVEYTSSTDDFVESAMTLNEAMLNSTWTSRGNRSKIVLVDYPFDSDTDELFRSESNSSRGEASSSCNASRESSHSLKWEGGRLKEEKKPNLIEVLREDSKCKDIADGAITADSGDLSSHGSPSKRRRDTCGENGGELGDLTVTTTTTSGSSGKKHSGLDENVLGARSNIMVLNHNPRAVDEDDDVGRDSKRQKHSPGGLNASPD